MIEKRKNNCRSMVAGIQGTKGKVGLRWEHRRGGLKHCTKRRESRWVPV